MAAVWIIILAIFCGLGGYCIGLRRGYKVYQTPWEDQNEAYYDGYNEGRLDPASHLINDWYRDGYEDGREYERQIRLKRKRQEEFITSLEDAFGPEDTNIIDGGTY